MSDDLFKYMQAIVTSMQAIAQNTEQSKQSLDEHKQQLLEQLKRIAEYISHLTDDVKKQIYDFLQSIDLQNIINVINSVETNINAQQELFKKLAEQANRLDNTINQNISTVNDVTQTYSQCLIDAVPKVIEGSQDKIADKVVDYLLDVSIHKHINFINNIEKIHYNVQFEVEKTGYQLFEKYQTYSYEQLSKIEECYANVFDEKSKLDELVYDAQETYKEFAISARNNAESMYRSYDIFQKKVYDNIAQEHDNINAYYTEKFEKNNLNMKICFDSTITTAENLNASLSKKANELLNSIDTNHSLIISKSESFLQKNEQLVERLENRLTGRIVLTNFNVIMCVLAIVLIGFNIAATKRHSDYSNYNQTLANEIYNKKQYLKNQAY
jgi:NTP pyrophosphatase (non-canonical NTP hydrolase)